MRKVTNTDLVWEYDEKNKVATCSVKNMDMFVGRVKDNDRPDRMYPHRNEIDFTYKYLLSSCACSYPAEEGSKGHRGSALDAFNVVENGLIVKANAYLQSLDNLEWLVQEYNRKNTKNEWFYANSINKYIYKDESNNTSGEVVYKNCYNNLPYLATLYCNGYPTWSNYFENCLLYTSPSPRDS